MYCREVWHCLCIQNTHFVCNNCVCYGMVSDRSTVKGLHKHAKMNGYTCPLMVATAHYFKCYGVSRCDVAFESEHFTPSLWHSRALHPTTNSSAIVIKKILTNSVELYNPWKGTVIARLFGQNQNMLKSYLKGKHPMCLYPSYRI